MIAPVLILQSYYNPIARAEQIFKKTRVWFRFYYFCTYGRESFKVNKLFVTREAIFNHYLLHFLSALQNFRFVGWEKTFWCHNYLHFETCFWWKFNFNRINKFFCEKHLKNLKRKSNGTQSKQLIGVVPYQQLALFQSLTCHDQMIFLPLFIKLFYGFEK